ncbi:MAG TPA: APC family permease [Dehalococcoidia bacterium]|nr:APC family permease [Dehalococcoidia bacterium]
MAQRGEPGGKDGEKPAEREPEPSVVRLERRRPPAEAGLFERVRTSRAGERTLRRERASEAKLRRIGEAEYEATPLAIRPETRLGRFWAATRALLIGPPLASAQLAHERLSKVKALAVFSSDNLSSSAYATEEMLLVLILAGTGALVDAMPISVAIALLAAIVATSYRQLIRAYPGGGGAYQVTKENLGVLPSLLIGSTLFVDYVLTVAVSTAAGVAAVTSAVPDLFDFRIELAIAFVALLTLGNLRGIRESGTLFAVPPYFFLLTFGGMLVVGIVRLALGDDLTAGEPPHPVEAGTQTLSVFLLLRAFASGCAALTGIEAIADGVPSFKPPEAKNASTTLMWMAGILSAFFLGTTFLATQLEVRPSETQTVVAQIAHVVFGGGVLFYAVQVGTAMILVLAANTAFAGLPTLASVMARDGVAPKQFSFRGDRLAFSNGILVLGLASAAVLFAFDAKTHNLVPLYAFGVFTAFTLSQAGMVVYWKRSKEPGSRGALIINFVGMVATGIVGVIVGATKFVDGAWLSMTAMALILLLLWRIRVHYREAQAQLGQGLATEEHVAAQYYSTAAKRVQPIVLVPIEEIDLAALRTVAYARSLSQNAVAIHVSDSRESAEALHRRWEESVPDVPLVIVESPYRSLVEPIIAYLDRVERTQPNAMITVVLPEFITHRPWQQFLHNQLSQRLKKALMDRPNTVIVEVPYHLTR